MALGEVKAVKVASTTSGRLAATPSLGDRLRLEGMAEERRWAVCE